MDPEEAQPSLALDESFKIPGANKDEVEDQDEPIDDVQMEEEEP